VKVLLVSGGHLPIPPQGWGGVENLIWQQKQALEQAGHQADILNDYVRGLRRFVAVLKARPWRYDVVHLHLDSYAIYWLIVSRLFRFPVAISTHYGYAAFPEKWDNSYRRTFRRMRRAKYLILISQEISDTFRHLGCRAKMFVIPNGIHCLAVQFSQTAFKQSIVLGRVEPRKKQAMIAQALDGKAVQCDFAGPIAPDVVFNPNDCNTHYLGEWSREQVHRELTNYACLILLSDGEGHAAVVSEAMAAGLSLVLSQEASHNLDTSKPWIYIVDRDKDVLSDVVTRAVQENSQYRTQIRQYCEANFDWSIILPRYIHDLECIARENG